MSHVSYEWVTSHMKESKESRTWNHHWLNERGGCKPHGSDALQKGTWQMQLLERQPHLFFCFCFFCCVRRCCDKCNCWDDSPIMKYYRWDCCDMNRWDMKILQIGLSWHESIDHVSTIPSVVYTCPIYSCHVSYPIFSCHDNESCHVSYVNESCLTCKWVMTDKEMNRVYSCHDSRPIFSWHESWQSHL